MIVSLFDALLALLRISILVCEDINSQIFVSENHPTVQSHFECHSIETHLQRSTEYSLRAMLKLFLITISVILILVHSDSSGEDGVTQCNESLCDNALIEKCAYCYGAGSCTNSKMFKNAICSGQSSCMRAVIFEDADCSGQASCSNAHILGNAACVGINACPNARITGNAVCDTVTSCAGAYVAGQCAGRGCP